MSATTTPAGANLTPRYGSATADCGGAQIRAHGHHLATVVTVQGDLDALNVGRVCEHVRRYILAQSPIILDVSGVNSHAAPALSLLVNLDEHCRAAGLQWTLVAGDSVRELLDPEFPIAGSVREALHNLADAIAKRRRLLLPLLGKTA